MHIAICDDRAEERLVLERLVEEYMQEHGHTLRFQSFSGGAELIEAAEKERFSLYFLDVIMPGMDGIATAREIRSFDSDADIVFLTSTTDFAYQSYGVHALDYLLKPIKAELLFPILDKLLLREQKIEEALTLKCGSTYIRLPFSQLTYVEVSGKHLYFNLADGSVREVVGSLNEYEPLLLIRPEFMRIHRSYIVNMLQAAELSPAGLVTFSGKNLPISRLLYPQVQKDYMKLLFAGKED